MSDTTENRERPLFAGCPTHPEHADRKHDYMGNLSNYGDPCSFQIEPVEGESVWWCKVHHCAGSAEHCAYGRVTTDPWHDPGCEMVPGLVVDLGNSPSPD